jgi:3-oxoacyl-[acyl-carrier protein] reductase
MKNILITGATGGIGNALVKKYFSAGYNICATGTNTEKLDLLAKNYSNKILCLQCDLAQKDQIKNLIESANKKFGHIDILINNAGVTRDNLFMRMKDAEWEEVIKLNLNSNFTLTKLVIRDMLKKKWGRVINISSDAAKIGNPGQSNYVASKSAIEGLTRTIANEVASRGITVNCVSPGFVNTEILSSLESSKLQSMLQRVPAGRIGEANEIADAVFFLSSEESSYITGQVLHVNGGLTM